MLSDVERDALEDIRDNIDKRFPRERRPAPVGTHDIEVRE